MEYEPIWTNEFVPVLKKAPRHTDVLRSGGRALRILNRGIRWKWAVSFMLRSRYNQERREDWSLYSGWATGWTIEGSRFWFSAVARINHLDRLWYSSSLQRTGCLGKSSRGVRMITHLHLVCPIRLLGAVRNETKKQSYNMPDDVLQFANFTKRVSDWQNVVKQCERFKHFFIQPMHNI